MEDLLRVLALQSQQVNTMMQAVTSLMVNVAQGTQPKTGQAPPPPARTGTVPGHPAGATYGDEMDTTDAPTCSVPIEGSRL